ncbi:MAG: peptidoglycan recognition family protein [Anaerovoracaceae bacterium]
MSNSKLVDYVRLSPNCSRPRKDKIRKITIHHMAGNISVETCGSVFAPTSRQASSNYGIDSRGRVGMYVEEKNRAWTSSSPANDHQAITIEVANDQMGGNWHVSDKALAKLIDLCVDICKRNDIKKLDYTGNTSGNLTKHEWFANTNCPGPYLGSKFSYIAKEVNKRLAGNIPTKPSPVTSIREGDKVKVKSGAYYYGSSNIVPSWVVSKTWIVSEVKGNRAVIDKSADGKNTITSPIDTKYLTRVSNGGSNAFKPYLVRIDIADLNIRKGPGINYSRTGRFTGKGNFTIVEEASGKGAKRWGKLKSCAGWISLDYTNKI